MGKFRGKFKAKKDDTWLAWLSDDPPEPEVGQVQQRPHPVTAAERLRYAGSYQRPGAPASPAPATATHVRSNIHPTARTSAPATPLPKTAPKATSNPKNKAPITVQISIHRPSLPKIPPAVLKKATALKQLKTKFTRKQILVVGSAFALLILIGIVSTLAVRSHKTTTTSGNSAGDHAGSSAAISPAVNITQPPSFKPIYPLGKPELATIKDPSKAIYEVQRQVFSFTDTLKSSPVIISQQPEPDSILKDAEGLQKTAKSIGALQSFDTHWGKAYQVTSPKTHNQTIVFVANGLLIFARSATAHDDNEWKAYINDLTF